MKHWNWILLAFVLVAMGCASNSYDYMAWQSDPVKIDGQSNEWSFPLKYYDSKSRMTFYASNDAKKLYLVFATGEEIARIKILTTGLRIEIDTDGKKTYPMSVTYSTWADVASRGMVPPKPYTNVPHDTTLHRPIRLSPISMQVAGFKNIPNGKIFVPNTYNMEAAIVGSDNSGRLFCEVSIPFASFYKDSLDESDEGKVFAIRVTLDKIDNPDGGGNGSGPQFSLVGGSGGVGGYNGGMGNGIPGGMDPMMNNSGSFNNAFKDVYTKRSFTVKLKPATP